MSAYPSESAIHRRAESRGFRVKKRNRKGRATQYVLVDGASGVVVREELDIEELVDLLASL